MTQRARLKQLEARLPAPPAPEPPEPAPDPARVEAALTSLRSHCPFVAPEELPGLAAIVATLERVEPEAFARDLNECRRLLEKAGRGDPYAAGRAGEPDSGDLPLCR